MKYFAIIDDKQVGPFTPEEMPAAGVRPSTYVWCKTMSDWRQAREVADICRFYRNHIYDINHPAPKVEDTAPTPHPLQESADNAPMRYQHLINPENIQSPTINDTDTSQPPKTSILSAILATIIFFFPTGIIAIILTCKANKLWKEGKAEESHEAARKAKMMIGFTICIGIIAVAVMMRFF